MEKLPYTVIGSGPMGLMVAMDLLAAGHDVNIYEKADRIGGMTATFNFSGQEIERYYHFICKTDYPLFELLDRLHISDRLNWTDTNMGFYHGNKLHDWGTPISLLKFPGLDIISKIRYGLMAMRAKKINDWHTLDKISATEWIRNQIGEKAYNVLWKSLFELKLHKYTDQTSAAWIGTRIKRVALSRRSLNQETMGYLSGGSGILLDAMVNYINDRGGKILLNSNIKKVVTQNGKAIGLEVNGEIKKYSQIISTIPIRAVPEIVPDLPEDYRKKIVDIQNIPVACVILKLNEKFTNKFWININDPDIEIPGLIEYSNLNPETSGIVYAPFYMPSDHPKWNLTNQEMIDEVKSYVMKINPNIKPENFVAEACHIYQYAQTICPVGFYEMLPSMETPIKNFLMADTAYYYPEDRSICESVAVGKKLATLAMSKT